MIRAPGPLPLPADAAAALFVERAFTGTGTTAAVASADDPDVRRVVCRLGCLPELVAAAARLTAIESVADLAARLEDDVELLSLPVDGRPLGDVVAGWAAPVAASDAAVMRRLAVMPGGFSAGVAQMLVAPAEVAQEVAHADRHCAAVSPAAVPAALRSAVARGVLERVGTEARERLRFVEPFRVHYLRELAAAGEEPEARRRQAAWCRSWASAVADEAASVSWVGSIDRGDVDNAASTIEWLERHEAAEAAHLIVALMPVWRTCPEGAAMRRRLDRIIDGGALAAGGPDWRRALLAAGELAALAGDLEAAAARFDACRASAEAEGDEADMAAASGWRCAVAHMQGDFADAEQLATAALELHEQVGNGTAVAGVLLRLGQLASVRGDRDTAQFRYQQALEAYRSAGDEQGVASALERLGQLRRIGQRHDEARTLLKEALQLRRRGGDPRAVANAAAECARAATDVEELDEARALASEALATYQALGDRRGIASVAAALGRVGYLAGDHAGSRRAYAEALETCEAIGDRRGTAVARLGLANAILLSGAEGPDVERAAALAQRALDALGTLGDDRSAAWAAYSLTGMYRDLGRYEDARRVADQCLDLCARTGDTRTAGFALLSVAHLARNDGDLPRALTLARQSLVASRTSSSVVQPLRCLTFIAGLAAAAGDDERATVLYGATAALRTRYGHPVARTALADDIAGDVAALRTRNADGVLWSWLERGAALSLESAVLLAGEPLAAALRARAAMPSANTIPKAPSATPSVAAAPTTSAQLRVLGRLEVTDADGVRAVPAGVEAHVLGRIAVLGPQHADALVDALWPDVTLEVGRRRLKNAMSKLRARVGPVVARDGDVCRLADGVVVDADRFAADAGAALRAWAAGDPHADGACRAALDHYHGELLPNERYEDWPMSARLRLAHLHLGLLDALADHAVASGHTAEAVDWLERAIEADPFELDRHVRLGDLLLGRGWRSRARAVTLRALSVADDLGFEPPAALGRLAGALEL